jgi:hypothetical protein
MTEAVVVFVNAVFVSSFRFVLRSWPLPPAGEASPLTHSQREESLRERIGRKKLTMFFQKRYAVRRSKKSEALQFFYVSEVYPVKILRTNGHGFVYF